MNRMLSNHTVTKMIRSAEDRMMANAAALHEAERAVRPIVGEVLGCDTAASVYHRALKIKGIDADGIRDVADLKALFNTVAPDVVTRRAAYAADEKRRESFAERWPDAARITVSP